MNSHLDIFAAETADESEWQLAGWAFVAEEQIWSGRIEVDGIHAGPLSCGWFRPDVPAAFPGQCPSAHVGFRAQVFLPPGLLGGEHRLELIFANREGVELGRVTRVFVTNGESSTVAAVGHPRINAQHIQADYLDLLEKTLLGLPYAETLQTLERREGQGWPETAHSMIGAARMRHLRACAETVLRDRIPGDFIETGVWRGGACILMRGVLKAYGDTARTVWVADSFAGLPPPNEQKYPADRGDKHHEAPELAIPLGQVQANFSHYGLLDAQVRFLKGWFSETLPDAEISQIAVLRLDGDMYESTMDALTHLYPKLSAGGYCIIDDYGAIPACRQAVRDYRVAQGIEEPISMIDWAGAFWRKQTVLVASENALPASTSTEASPLPPEPTTPTSPDDAARAAFLQLSPALTDVRVGHPDGAWTEHIPFAFWLVDQLCPRVIVELGVHTGGSYCAFCQAVEQSRLETRCYGVDTFQGDEHAGHYTSSVLEQLRAHHDPRYGRFSTIIQSSFKDALSRFEDGAIDLLHIDGLHYYESVKEDFETWLPKLSRRAIVLFHDTQVRERDFGVFKFWAELERRHPSLEFFHGYGLGVLAVGRDIPRAVSGMLFTSDEGKAFARRLFSTLGSRLALQLEIGAFRIDRSAVAELSSQRDALEAQQRLAQQSFLELTERFEESQAQSRTLLQEQTVHRSQIPSQRQTPATVTPHGALKHAWQHLRYQCIAALPFLRRKPLRAQQELAEGSGLFDAEFYRSQLPPGQSVRDASLHYLLIGWRSGLSPHRLFDVPWYIHTYQEQLKGREPLMDYLQKGWKKNRCPNPSFDPKWYRDTYLKKSGKDAHPFKHYLETGMEQGYRPNATALPQGTAALTADLLHYEREHNGG